LTPGGVDAVKSIVSNARNNASRVQAGLAQSGAPNSRVERFDVLGRRAWRKVSRRSQRDCILQRGQRVPLSLSERSGVRAELISNCNLTAKATVDRDALRQATRLYQLSTIFRVSKRALLPKPTGEANRCNPGHVTPKTLPKALYVGFFANGRPLQVVWFGGSQFPVPEVRLAG